MHKSAEKSSLKGEKSSPGDFSKIEFPSKGTQKPVLGQNLEFINEWVGSGYLVEGCCESTVNVVSVENCHSNDPPHKVEVGKMVGVDAAVSVDLKGVNVLPVEQRKVKYFKSLAEC